jgi:hypothetical protein
MRVASLLVVLVSVLVSRALPLRLESKSIPEPEMGNVELLVIHYGDGEFSLVPPRGWQARAKADTETVEIVSPDRALTLRIIFSTNPASAVLASAAALRQKILPEIADAQVIEEFPAYGGDRQGKGMELSFDAQGHQMKCRAAVVPINGGTAGFVLTSGSMDFEPARQAFGAVLTSFRHKSRAKTRP